jgi:Domain of unknown function (DUF4136)
MTALCFKRLVAPTLALGLMSVAAAAQSVDVSYDRTADFRALKTYALGTVTVTGDAEPLMVQRTLSAVDSQMSAIGFQKVEKDPDVLVATQHWRGVSYPYWWWNGFTEIDLPRIFATRVALEMIDARTGKVVFRGTAEDTVSLKPSRNERKAYEAVAEIFEESPWGADFDDD